MKQLISWILLLIAIAYLIGMGTYLIYQDYPNHKGLKISMLVISALVFSFSISAEMSYPGIKSMEAISNIHIFISCLYMMILVIFDLLGEIQESIRNKALSIGLTIISVIISILITIFII